jgi:UDP-N-acetylenolpyruvoylglucosamine reductase
MADDDTDWKDLINVKDLAKKNVKDKYNIDLEEEIRIIKN